MTIGRSRNTEKGVALVVVLGMLTIMAAMVSAYISSVALHADVGEAKFASGSAKSAALSGMHWAIRGVGVKNTSGWMNLEPEKPKGWQTGDPKHTLREELWTTDPEGEPETRFVRHMFKVGNMTDEEKNSLPSGIAGTFKKASGRYFSGKTGPEIDAAVLAEECTEVSILFVYNSNKIVYRSW